VRLEPETGDGELIQVILEGDVVVGTGKGPEGPPGDKACPKCYAVGETPPPSTETHAKDARKGDNGGSSVGLIIGIVAAVAAALVVIVGGAAFFVRRRGGGA
jgi:hypothetical protein